MRKFQMRTFHTATAIKKILEVGQTSSFVSSKERTTALYEVEAVDLKGKVQVLGRPCVIIVIWEATSDFPQDDAVSASVVRLASNFHSYNELVETISQVHFREGESSVVMDRRRRVEPSDQLSIFRTSI